MPETPERIVWTNTEAGNDHAVIARPGSISMRVKKPGTDARNTWESGPVATVSTPEEWEAAFRGLGPQWNQLFQNNTGDHYTADRRVNTEREELIWRVDHTKIGKEVYEIRDQLAAVLLKQQSDKATGSAQ